MLSIKFLVTFFTFHAINSIFSDPTLAQNLFFKTIQQLPYLWPWPSLLKSLKPWRFIKPNLCAQIRSRMRRGRGQLFIGAKQAHVQKIHNFITRH